VPAMPPALADLRGFRGRIDYVAHRDGTPPAQSVAGTLFVDDRRWSLDERASAYALHADSEGAALGTDGGVASIGDVFESDGLANAWAAALGVLATAPIVPTGHGAWTSGAGLRAYVDASGARIIGIADASGRNQVSFALDGWTSAGMLAVPQRVLRLRAGLPDAAYSIAGYVVTPASAAGDRLGARAHGRSIGDPLAPGMMVLPLGALAEPGRPMSLGIAALVALLIAALSWVAWTRRDALVLALCRRMARDPRGWKRAGTSLFVGPDGALVLDGIRYRVGPHFYNRATLVQCSALFIRVSAPAVPHAVILARRFRPIDLGIRAHQARRASHGFTLIETLIATALFAAILLLGVYPALAALARADALAQERAAAVVIAANALADEEVANAYGAGAPATGTATTTIDGLTLTVTVTPSSTRFVSDVDILVAGAGGNAVAHLVTVLGPPLAPPPHSSGGPPGA